MSAVKAPTATRHMPMIPENPVGGVTGCAPTASDSCRTNKENLTTTKPKPMRAILVRIHARNVRSLARWSLGLPLGFSLFMLNYFDHNFTAGMTFGAELLRF